MSHAWGLLQVRSDWGIKESVGIHGWQAVMKQYLRQDRLQGLKAFDKLSGDASAGRVTSSLAEDHGNDNQAPLQGMCPVDMGMTERRATVSMYQHYLKQCAVTMLVRWRMTATLFVKSY